MPAPNRQVDEHGFPIPVTFGDEPPREITPRQGRWIRGILAILVVAVIGGILLGPEIKQGYYQSLAEWHAQQAEASFLEGNAAAAAAEMTDAIYWLPDSAQLYERRAQYHQECQQLDAAMADLNKVLELNSNYYRAYMDRGFVYFRLGKHAECLADANTAVSKSHSGNPYPLNHRAYMRALTRQELKEGLADAEKALKLTRESDAMHPAFLDTRGYLRHLLGDEEGALKDLNKAIQIAERRRKEPEDFVDRRRYDARRMALLLEKLGQDLAVMYHHRGEVQQKLGQDEAAAADMALAEKLGYDPDKGVL